MLSVELDRLQHLRLSIRCEWLAEMYLALTYAESVVGLGRHEEYRRSADCRNARAAAVRLLAELHELLFDEGLRTTQTQRWFEDLVSIFNHDHGWQWRDEFAYLAVRIGHELEIIQRKGCRPEGRIARPGWVRDAGQRPAAPRMVTAGASRRFRN